VRGRRKKSGHRKKADEKVGTHELESEEGGSSWDTERRLASETHVLESIEGGQVKMPERRQARGTHFLESINGRSKGIEKKASVERHSLPEEKIGE
jgi:hypothetical protein